jgi:hypothetical protein
VTDDLDRQVQQALRRRRRSPRIMLYVCIVAAVAGISGYIWLNHDSLGNLAFAEHSSVVPVVQRSDTAVTREDLDAIKRQMAESLRSMVENIDALKTDLKNLSDQVTALAAKVDGLQTARQSLELRPGPQPSAVPVRLPVIAARKKPAVPQTTGQISVGGAPLPAAPASQ